jgi:hypothetical protein
VFRLSRPRARRSSLQTAWTSQYRRWREFRIRDLAADPSLDAVAEDVERRERNDG